MSLIISIIPLFFIGYYMYFSSKRNDISYEVKSGSRCFNCLKYLGNERFFFDHKTGNITFPKRRISQCKSCKRDDSINIVTNNLKYKLLRKFKYFSLTKPFEIILLILISLTFVFIFLNIYLFYSCHSNLEKSLTYNTLNTISLSIFWTLMILKYKFYSTKKGY